MKSSQKAKEEIKKEKETSMEKEKQAFEQTIADVTNKMLIKGVKPKDAIGLDNTYLENIYAQAYRLYNTGKYGEAIHLFRMLIMLNAMEPKYLLGLAASLHMLKEYYDAIQTYTLCSAMDPTNPIPHYHTSDCFVQMKDYLSAMISLELVVEKAADKPEYAKMKERALMSLESLKKQLCEVPSGTEALLKTKEEQGN